MLYNTFMNDKTLTDSIIHYLHYHRGITFDVKRLHDFHFKESNYDSFRKIISRLANKGEITHLGLTLYFNGEIEERFRFQTVLDYFINERCGYYRGDTLLYFLGIIEEQPEVFEINCNVERGVTCCGVKAVPFGKHGVGKRFSMVDFYCLCELMRIENTVDDDHYYKLINKMHDFAGEVGLNYLEYKSGLAAFGLDTPFPRYIYFKVANLLQSFNLYNEVIEWYEDLQERKTGEDI